MTTRVFSKIFCLSISLVSSYALSADTAAAKYRAKLLKKKLSIEENVKGEWLQVFSAACEVLTNLDQGRSYACKDESGYRGNRATLNFRSGKGVILAKIPSIGTKSRTAFQCAVTASQDGLIHCVLAGGRKFAGRPGLVSPFASGVDGVRLPNAHWLVEPSHGTGGVMRSMNPQLPEDYQSLVAAGINRVLVFKNFDQKEPDTQTGDDEGETDEDGPAGLQDEYDGFAAHGIPQTAIKDIPFPYHGFSSYQSGCEMMVDALKIVSDARKDALKRKTNILFHCTVGEDRTGSLAGLFTLLEDRSLPMEGVFESQMCEFGYASGNPFKPFKVNNNIQRDLTPLFVFMAQRIKEGELKTSFDKGFCKDADTVVPTLKVPSCKISTRLYVEPLATKVSP